MLDEIPENKKAGYLIVFDEKSLLFGLALKASIESGDIGYYVGGYGTFITTLDAM